MQEHVVDSVRVADGVLTVATQNPLHIFEPLPGWLAQTGVRVTEMHSADESLQALFNSLMKMHRGEL
jgi:ABC-2 type transport system ATP-binding protein